MAYLALYRKHRPRNFDQIVGQKAVVTALRNQVKYGQIGHAYLFCGTRGTGKTSTAKVFARAVNCLHPVDGNPCNECELCLDAESGFNVIEIDAASNNGVDNIRDLREEVQYSPSQGKYKVYIIDEVHMLSTAAFNALLKTLEEPPEHAIFILATTDPQKVIPTIVSRCQRYDFRRITTEEIFGQLKKVCELEGIQAEDAALDYIAGLADGGMRDALSILDQAHAYYIDRPITLADVEEVLGAVDGRIFSQMTGYLAAGDIAGLLDGVGRVFDAGRDAIQFVSSWNAYLRNLLVVKVLKNQAKGLVRETEQTTQMLYEQSSIASEDQITTWIEALARLESRLKTSSSRRILIEVELIRLGSGTYGAAADSPVPASRGMAGASVGVSQMRPEPVRMQSGAGALSSGIRQTSPAAAPAGQVKDMPNEASPRQADGAGAKMNPLGQGAASAGETQKTSGPSAADVAAKWPVFRDELIRQSRNLYTLTKVDMQPGNGPDELFLVASEQIYIDQLSMQDGEKLKIIIDFIRKKTGKIFTIRLIRQEEKKVWTKEDFASNIHMDIHWQS